ncbi:hypothetical protein ACFS2C_14025 [Prauserella oleivorans]|uniref:Uncharacterized protein n=1 Tax=Prauserella oleivorans TaxID=1478153 RepID=A0ABW5WB89_9PSEU
MSGYRYSEQHRPPEARQVTDVAIERFEDVFEVDPKLMTVHVAQQVFPNWDTLRIVASRHDHLDWMHRHWARKVVSGQRLLDEMDE